MERKDKTVTVELTHETSRTERDGRLQNRTSLPALRRASASELQGAFAEQAEQSTAIACWNTIYLDRAVDRLRGRGGGAPEPLLPHVSPPGWGHIALTGDYLWDSAAIDPRGFRPLNDPSGRLDAIA